jgi:hypothetical protein
MAMSKRTTISKSAVSWIGNRLSTIRRSAETMVTPSETDIQNLIPLLQTHLGLQGGPGIGLEPFGGHQAAVTELLDKVSAIDSSFAEMRRNTVAVADLSQFPSLAAGAPLGEAVPELAKQIERQMLRQREESQARSSEQMNKEELDAILQKAQSNPSQYVVYSTPGDKRIVLHDLMAEKMVDQKTPPNVVFVNPARIIQEAYKIEPVFKEMSVPVAMAGVVVHELAHQNMGTGESGAESAQQAFFDKAQDILEKEGKLGGGEPNQVTVPGFSQVTPPLPSGASASWISKSMKRISECSRKK